MKRGLFITLEGGEGSGKSTQLRLLGNRIRRLNIPLTMVREPGGTPLGNRLRRLLKFSAIPLMDEAELLLFNASRAQLVRDVIRPSLDDGNVVLCDRFYDSTLAYQGYGRGIPLEQVEVVNSIATGGLKPDLTILLDLLPEEGMQRRSTGKDRFESGFEQKINTDFHHKVRQGYMDLVHREPERWFILDARSSKAEISGLIWEKVELLLESKCQRLVSE